MSALDVSVFSSLVVTFALTLLVFAIILRIILRWVFRIDHVVNVLDKSKKHLEDIKEQNNTLIKQQDEIIYLLNMER